MALALLCAAWFLGALDGSIVTVALPAIGRDLGLSVGDQQWVLTSYALVGGSLLLLGGRAGDLFGRRRLFLTGLALFSIASLIGGLAVAPWMLIVARVVQGAAAAAFGPAALALVTSIFAEGPERDRAVGIFSAMGALGFAAGVALGGAITEFLGWRWVMFAALPIALPLLVLTPLIIAERRHAVVTKGLDIPGAVAVATGLGALLYALSVAADRGWTSPAAVGLLALGLLLLAGFVATERRSRAPLVPLSVFRVRSVAVANAAKLMHATSSASTYVLMLYLQEALGRSPLEATLLYLPLPIVGAAAAPVAGWLMARLHEPKTTIVLGLGITAVGWLVMALMSTEDRLAIVISGGVISAVGRVVTIVALTIVATSGVGDDQKGLAAGLVGTSGQIGAALGLAAIGAIVSAHMGAPGPGEIDPQTLVGGLRAGVLIGAAFVVVALLIVLLGLRARHPQAQSQPT